MQSAFQARSSEKAARHGDIPAPVRYASDARFLNNPAGFCEILQRDAFPPDQRVGRIGNNGKPFIMKRYDIIKKRRGTDRTTADHKTQKPGSS